MGNAPRSRNVFLLAGVIAAVLVALLIKPLQEPGEETPASPAPVNVMPAAHRDAAPIEPGNAAEPQRVTPLEIAAAESPDDATPQPDADLIDEPGPFAGVPREWMTDCTIRGRVVDEQGTPLAGANIIHWLDDVTTGVIRQATGSVPENRPSTTTAADGSFELRTRRGLPGAGVTGIERRFLVPDILVDDPRCVALSVTCPATMLRDIDLGTLVVEAGAVLSGRVVDERGEPIAGIHVGTGIDPFEHQVPWAARGNALPEGITTAVTDHLGRYELRGLWPADGEVCVREPGWRVTSVSLPPWSKGARVAVPDLVADRGSSLHGVVLDEAGQPIAGAMVVLRHAASLSGSTSRTMKWSDLNSDELAHGATTSAKGSFRIDGLDNERVAVLAGVPDDAVHVLADRWPGDAPVELRMPRPAPRPSDHVIELQLASAGAALPATVFVDARGAIAPEWELKALPVERLTADRFVIDATGRCRITAFIRAKGFAATLAPLSTDEPTARTVKIVTLVPEARIEGVVVDDLGAPVPFAWVRALPGGRDDEFGGVTQTVADGEGRFSLGDLDKGQWVLDVVADGMTPNSTTQLDLSSEAHRRDVTVTMTRAGVIEGRVSHADGTTPRLSFAEITLETLGEAAPTGHARLKTSFDADGRFAFRGLQPGNYRLRGQFGAAIDVVVNSGETAHVDFVLPLWPTVRGRVLSGGRPVVGAFVRSEPVQLQGRQACGAETRESWITAWAESDAEGRFTMRLDCQGRMEVWAETSGGDDTDKVSVFVTPDAEVLADLILKPGRLTGQVVDAESGAPIADATVSLDAHAPVATNDEGRFTLVGLSPGEYKLRASARGHVDELVAHVAIGPDEAAAELRVALRRAESLVITWLGPNGRPLPSDGVVCGALWRADLGALADGSAWRWVNVDDETGRDFEERLEPGRYRVGWFVPRSADGNRGNDITPWECPASRLESLTSGIVDVDVAAGESKSVTVHVPSDP